MVLDYLFIMIQRYEKKLRYANFSLAFFCRFYNKNHPHVTDDMRVNDNGLNLSCKVARLQGRSLFPTALARLLYPPLGLPATDDGLERPVGTFVSLQFTKVFEGEW